jgi:phosphotransferase system  glucose/maltose/N-acetylglucosamine-specific IIC component
MYRNVDADKKAKYKSMYFSAALAVFLTGVTEQIPEEPIIWPTLNRAGVQFSKTN